MLTAIFRDNNAVVKIELNNQNIAYLYNKIVIINVIINNYSEDKI